MAIAMWFIYRQYRKWILCKIVMIIFGDENNIALRPASIQHQKRLVTSHTWPATTSNKQRSGVYRGTRANCGFMSHATFKCCYSDVRHLTREFFPDSTPHVRTPHVIQMSTDGFLMFSKKPRSRGEHLSISLQRAIPSLISFSAVYSLSHITYTAYITPKANVTSHFLGTILSPNLKSLSLVHFNPISFLTVQTLKSPSKLFCILIRTTTGSQFILVVF